MICWSLNGTGEQLTFHPAADVIIRERLKKPYRRLPQLLSFNHTMHQHPQHHHPSFWEVEQCCRDWVTSALEVLEHRISPKQQMGLTQTRQSAPIPKTGHMCFPASHHIRPNNFSSEVNSHVPFALCGCFTPRHIKISWETIHLFKDSSTFISAFSLSATCIYGCIDPTCSVLIQIDGPRADLLQCYI